MKIEVRCPHCGRGGAVPPAGVGKPLVCKGCGGRFKTVEPGQAGIQARAPALPPPAAIPLQLPENPSEEAEVAQRPYSGLLILAVSFLSVLLLCGGAATGLVLYFKHEAKPQVVVAADELPQQIPEKVETPVRTPLRIEPPRPAPKPPPVPPKEFLGPQPSVFSVTVASAHKEWRDNAVLAKEKYTGTWVEVRGRIAGITEDHGVYRVSFLWSRDGGRVYYDWIWCRFDNKQDVLNLKTDQTVAIVGLFLERRLTAVDAIIVFERCYMAK